MKIQMIGTGSITAKENPASVLIDEHLLVDCGNGIVKALLKNEKDIFGINTILITHLHGDHYADLPFLIIPRSFTPVNNECVIYGPKGITENLKAVIKLIYDDVEPLEELCTKGNVRIVEFDDLEAEIDGYEIKSHLVDHGDFSPAYGFTIKKYSQILGISGDSTLCDGVREIIEAADAVICDTSFVKMGKSHMGAETLVALSEAYNKLLIATHMTPESRKYLIKSNKNNIIVPFDYDVIEL